LLLYISRSVAIFYRLTRTSVVRLVVARDTSTKQGILVFDLETEEVVSCTKFEINPITPAIEKIIQSLSQNDTITADDDLFILPDEYGKPTLTLSQTETVAAPLPLLVEPAAVLTQLPVVNNVHKGDTENTISIVHKGDDDVVQNQNTASVQQAAETVPVQSSTTIQHETILNDLTVQSNKVANNNNNNQIVDTTTLPNVESRYPKRSNRTTYQQASLNRHSEGFLSYELSEDIALNLSIKESLQEEPEKAKQAILSEFRQLIVEYRALSPIHCRDATSTILPSKMVMKKKYKANGFFDKWKARLAAGGHRQDKTLYPNNSSPTVQPSSVMIELNIAAHEDRYIDAVDIKGAFLNATLTKPQYIRLSKEAVEILLTLFPEFIIYVENNGTMICEVNQALYGLIESNQLWYLLLKKDLESIGYKVSPYDKCVFTKTIEYDNKIYRSTICLHVDDMLHTFNLKESGKELNEFLIKKYNDITLQTGDSISYVGMQIIRNRENRSITLNQTGYIESFLTKFKISGTAKTPSTDALTKNIEESENIPADVDTFLSGVMTLMYLALQTRPDILFVTLMAQKIWF
jgi:hypothetical protein